MIQLFFLFSLSISHSMAQTSLETLLKPLGGKASGNRCLYSRDQLVNYSMIYGYEPLNAYWACTMLRKHLNRDSKFLCRPGVSKAFSPLKSGQTLDIKGTLAFLGMVPLPYRYEASSSLMENANIEVKIHFQGADATASNLAKMRPRLKAAELIWEKHSPLSKPTSFSFLIADKKSNADFSVKLQQADTRGPYLRTWSLNWSVNTIAHEVGHMMGLDDEYDNARITLLGKTKIPYDKLMRCNPGSLMCSSSTGRPMPYHYYAILRRSHCID